jgi:hypothetical protein
MKKEKLNIQKKIYYKHIRLENIYHVLSRKIKINDISKLFYSFSYEHHRYAQGIRATMINENQSLLLLLTIHHRIDSHWVGLLSFYLGNTFLKYYLKKKEKEIISLAKLLTANLPNNENYNQTDPMKRDDENNTLFHEIEQCSEIHIQNIDSFDRIK